MNGENLLKVYEEQRDNLNGLLETALNKQKAIIDNSRDLMEKYSVSEESFVSKIKRKELERQNVLQVIFTKPNGTYDIPRRSDELMRRLKDHFNDEDMNVIMKVRDEIKSVGDKIKGVNQQNRFLLEQANSVVKQALDILLQFQKNQ